MRTTEVKILGINRNIGSSDNDTGFCTELINLKEQDGIKVVGEKEVVSASIPYTDVRIHKIGKVTNYIGMQNDANGIQIVHFNSETGTVIQQIAEFTAGSEVYYSILSNQIVISDKTSIKEMSYMYDIDNKKYKAIYYGNIDFNFNIKEFPLSYIGDTDSVAVDIKVEDSTQEEFIASMQAEVNKYESANINAYEGYLLYCLTITYADGTEDGLHKLTFIDASLGTPPSEDFIKCTGNNYIDGKQYYTVRFNRQYYYKTFTIQIDEIEEKIYEKYKDSIRSINLYVSKPISRYPLTKENVNISYFDGSIITLPSVIVGTKYPCDELGLEKTLLYLQKTWDFKTFCNGVAHLFEFDGDAQTTAKTMEVYASNLERAGKMYSYNNRLNFYNSSVRLNNYLGDIKYSPYISMSDEGWNEYILAKATVLVYVKSYYKDMVFKYDEKSVMIGVSSNIDEKYNLLLPNMVIFPDSRTYRADIIITSIISDGDYSDAINKMCSIYPISSPAYNYSYYFMPRYIGVGKIHLDKDFDGVFPTLNNTYEETDIINITASGNPIVFPVDYSYRFNGNITALSTSFDDITDSQVGQYPLNIFTDNGIYAMEQGSGEVLYSRIIPISPDSCTNESIVNTKSGIAYITNNGVFLLRGKQSTKLSLLIDGDADMFIQNNQSFLKCCGGELYNITPLLSQGFFKDYMNGAKLSYSTNANELVVSNPKYTYSYIYDFVYNSWYKVGGTFDRIDYSLMLTPIDRTEMEATPATGEVTVQAIHQEPAKTFQSLCKATYDVNGVCNVGDTIALVINESQIASATFSQVTYMPMIIATLCDKIAYLEDTKGTMYSKADLSGQVLKIINTTTSIILCSTTFISNSELVDIPNKAIGADVSIEVYNQGQGNMIETFEFTYNYTESSSVITMLNNITDQINNSDRCPVTAQTINNKIILTSKEKGNQSNDIVLEVYTSDKDYIYIQKSGYTLSGGQDISLTPSQYNQIIDWDNEQKGGQTAIHLHTRPVHLEKQNTFKTIRRTVLNCLANLQGEQNLSIYVYASNNLIDWKCIIAAQRKNCKISQITTDRASKAYKYFIFMIGGIVPNNTQLSNILLSVEDITNRKLR